MPFSQTYPAIVIPNPCVSFFSCTVNDSVSGRVVIQSGGTISIVSTGNEAGILSLISTLFSYDKINYLLNKLNTFL